MLRQVSSPLVHNLYRSTVASATCAYRLQLSYYSTAADKAEKTDKKQQKPPKQQQPPKSTPSSSSPPSSSSSSLATTPTIKKSTKAPTNPNLPFSHLSFSYENIHPVYEYSKTREDRVLSLEDLVGHISKNPYKNDKFQDSIKVEDAGKIVGKLKEKKFSLYGVFDGHQGNFAADYVKERLPFELVASPEFAAGNYEAAIKNAYAAVHKALLEAKGYVPQSPRYDFTSGTTASIALVTPSTTFFAQLGNTPIVVKQGNDKEPKVLFPQPNPEDVERLRTSDVFLMVNYAPVSDPKDRKEFWLEKTKANEDHAHGVSNITTLGSLGDSLYEPSTYNAFVSALRAYRVVADANSKKRISSKNANDHGSIFRGFVEFAKKSPEWKAIEKHVKIASDRNDSSWIINGFVDGDFKVPGEIKHGSLRREPQVTAIANEGLKYAHIMSDGVLVRKYNQDLHAMREIDRVAARNEGKSREVMGATYSGWIFGNFNDDISSVTIQYQK